MQKEIDSLQVTQAERIIDKYSGQISEAFNSGVEKITPVAEQGWEMAVKYQVALGIKDVSVALFWLIILMIILYNVNKAWKWAKQEDEEDMMGLIFGFTALVGGSLCAVVIAYLADGILYLIAPEWFALQEVIGLFK